MQKDKTIQAKTFTCFYSEKEDRLLLTINYEDVQNRVDFWITRAFLLKLLPHFFDYTTKIELKDDKTLPNTSSTDTSTFVLTQKTPLLLESVDITPLENDSLQLVFKNVEHTVYCIATFDTAGFNAFAKLITSTPPKNEWGIYEIN